MEAKKTTPLEAFGALSAFILSAVVQSFLGAYVAITLYHWFMIPVGAPGLTTGQLYGVLFFLRALLFKAPDKPKDERGIGEILLSGIGKGILIAGLTLGLGWVLHSIIY
jgi:hypothetical protein